MMEEDLVTFKSDSDSATNLLVDKTDKNLLLKKDLLDIVETGLSDADESTNATKTSSRSVSPKELLRDVSRAYLNDQDNSINFDKALNTTSESVSEKARYSHSAKQWKAIAKREETLGNRKAAASALKNAEKIEAAQNSGHQFGGKEGVWAPAPSRDVSENILIDKKSWEKDRKRKAYLQNDSLLQTAKQRGAFVDLNPDNGLFTLQETQNNPFAKEQLPKGLHRPISIKKSDFTKAVKRSSRLIAGLSTFTSIGAEADTDIQQQRLAEEIVKQSPYTVKRTTQQAKTVNHASLRAANKVKRVNRQVVNKAALRRKSAQNAASTIAAKQKGLEATKGFASVAKRAARATRNVLVGAGHSLASLGAPVIAVVLIVVIALGALTGLSTCAHKQPIDLSALNETERAVATYLLGKDLDAVTVAAIMGNISQESGFIADYHESGGGGYGLCQWTGGRRTQLEAYAASRGMEVATISLQMDFLWAELTGEDANGAASFASQQFAWNSSSATFRAENSFTGRPTWDEFKSITDVSVATEYFMWAFERPNAQYANLSTRINGDDVGHTGSKQYLLVLRGHSGGNSEAVNAAITKVGCPYVWAAAGPNSFDCSGLVVWAYAQAGVTGLPHFTDSLYDLCTKVSADDLQPGDLVFTNKNMSGNRWGHVMLYIGEGQVIQANGDRSRYNVSIDDLYSGWWNQSTMEFGRLP